MACTLLWSSAVRVNDSQAYRKMNVTREHISGILELREILLYISCMLSLYISITQNNLVVTESLPLYISTTQTNMVVTESLPLYISTTQADLVVTEYLPKCFCTSRDNLVVTEPLYAPICI